MLLTNDEQTLKNIIAMRGGVVSVESIKGAIRPMVGYNKALTGLCKKGLLETYIVHARGENFVMLRLLNQSNCPLN